MKKVAFGDKKRNKLDHILKELLKYAEINLMTQTI